MRLPWSSRNAIEVVESYADGLVDHKRLLKARDDARKAQQRLLTSEAIVAWRAANAAQNATRDTGRSAAANSLADAARAMNPADTNQFNVVELRGQTQIFRCVFGNPFRTETCVYLARWQNEPSIMELAQAIYDERAFDRLPTLADALMRVDCTVPEAIEHCATNGPHFRGCWVVDSLLGRT